VGLTIRGINKSSGASKKKPHNRAGLLKRNVHSRQIT
jgi:hypothetical protein